MYFMLGHGQSQRTTQEGSGSGDLATLVLYKPICWYGRVIEKIWSGQVMFTTSPYRAAAQHALPTGDCPEAAPYFRWH